MKFLLICKEILIVAPAGNWLPSESQPGKLGLDNLATVKEVSLL